MRIDLRGLITVLIAAGLAFVINLSSASRYPRWLSLALVLSSAFVLQISLEFIFQVMVPFLRPTLEGQWLEIIEGPWGPRYSLCTVDLEPGRLRGRFHGRSYDEFGNRTGEFESTTVLLDSSSSFLYEFTGTVYMPGSKSTTVQGMGHLQFDVSVRGCWIKGHGHFFHVFEAGSRFVVELERLTPKLRKALTGRDRWAEPFQERELVRAYHARLAQNMSRTAIEPNPAAPAVQKASLPGR